jgi:hypothetical protein
MEQVSYLSNEPPPEVTPEAPRLKLRAMGQLVREDREIALAAVGKEDSITQGHCPVSTELEHDSASPTRNAGCLGAVQPDGLAIEQ